MTGLSCNSSVVGITFSFILASYVAIAQLLFARKIWLLGGEMDILEHIYRQFLRRTGFCNFTHFIVIYRLLQFFKVQVFRWGEDACNLNSLWYSEFSYEMHGHLDFSERLFFPSSGFTLVEVAVRNKIKRRKWGGMFCLLREDDSIRVCCASIGNRLNYDVVRLFQNFQILQFAIFVRNFVICNLQFTMESPILLLR